MRERGKVRGREGGGVFRAAKEGVIISFNNHLILIIIIYMYYV